MSFPEELMLLYYTEERSECLGLPHFQMVFRQLQRRFFAFGPHIHPPDLESITLALTLKFKSLQEPAPLSLYLV